MLNFHRDYDFIQRHLNNPDFKEFYNSLGNITPKKHLLFDSFKKSLKEIDIVFVNMLPKIDSTGSGFYSYTVKTKEEIIFSELFKESFEKVKNDSLYITLSPTYDLDKFKNHRKEWANIVNNLIKIISLKHPKIWIFLDYKENIELKNLIKNQIEITNYVGMDIESIPISQYNNYVFNMTFDNVDKEIKQKINYILLKTKNKKL